MYKQVGSLLSMMVCMTVIYISWQIIAFAVTVEKVSTFNRLKGEMLSPHYDAYKPVKYDL
jgi:hypothetical protein